MKKAIFLFLVSITFFSCMSDRTNVLFGADGISKTINTKTELRTIQNGGTKPIYVGYIKDTIKQRASNLRILLHERDSSMYRTIKLTPGEKLTCNRIVEVYKGLDDCGHQISAGEPFELIGYFDSDSIFHKEELYHETVLRNVVMPRSIKPVI